MHFDNLSTSFLEMFKLWMSYIKCNYFYSFKRRCRRKQIFNLSSNDYACDIIVSCNGFADCRIGSNVSDIFFSIHSLPFCQFFKFDLLQFVIYKMCVRIS